MTPRVSSFDSRIILSSRPPVRLLAWGEVTNENEQGDGLATRRSAPLDEKVGLMYYGFKIYFQFWRIIFAPLAGVVPSSFTD